MGQSLSAAGDVLKGVGEGAWEGAKGMVEGVGTLAHEAVDLATSGSARRHAWETATRDAKAIGHFAETATTHPDQAAAQVEHAVHGAVDHLAAAYRQAASEGHGGEFVGKLVGEGAVVVGTAFIPGGAEAEAVGAVGDTGRIAVLAGDLGRSGKLADALDLAGGVGRSAEVDGVTGQLGRSRALLSEADPARDVLGPAIESHPVEIAQLRQRLADAGVEVIERPDAMAYAPGLRPGEPGQFFIDPDASYSAWQHEFQHVADDQAQGWGGMRRCLDPDVRWGMEQSAYRREIDLMGDLGHHGVVEQLQRLQDAERQKIFGIEAPAAPAPPRPALDATAAESPASGLPRATGPPMRDGRP